MEFFCIADKESSLGYKLSGVETREVSSRPEALEGLKVALAMEKLGIIIITSKAASWLRVEIDEIIYKQEIPLILEVPSKGGQIEGRGIEDFLKGALGVSV